jgi:hypothetical protein
MLAPGWFCRGSLPARKVASGPIRTPEMLPRLGCGANAPSTSRTEGDIVVGIAPLTGSVWGCLAGAPQGKQR